MTLPAAHRQTLHCANWKRRRTAGVARRHAARIVRESDSLEPSPRPLFGLAPVATGASFVRQLLARLLGVPGLRGGGGTVIPKAWGLGVWARRMAGHILFEGKGTAGVS